MLPLESVTPKQAGTGGLAEEAPTLKEIVPVAPTTLNVDICTVMPALEAKLLYASASCAEIW